jgi:aryl-alcohol dehydrogenase-like predicted oxidoreductase
MENWKHTVLGRTGREVGRLGMAGGYGVPTDAVERAFEQGINYLYWGSMRRDAFAQALRNLNGKRDKFVLVVQSYSRVAALVGWSLERALRKVGMDYADVLLLGLWNRAPADKILDAARQLRARGLIRHIAVSTHHRPLVTQLASNPDLDVFHLRYNAAHPGAEREIFPLLPANESRPGMVAFTATSWRQLLKPKNTPPGDKTPSAVDCYRFVLSNAAIDVCMTGPSSAAHVHEALKAFDLGPMSPEELAWMRRVGESVHPPK